MECEGVSKLIVRTVVLTCKTLKFISRSCQRGGGKSFGKELKSDKGDIVVVKKLKELQ
jgi:hypothetical protein